MGGSRPSIPIKLRRQVLVEAGHRCAIPTCRQIPVDVHHIVPFEECQEHCFQNLVVLCCNCHARYHRYKDIDRHSLKAYKANLSLLSNRYNPFEMRMLRYLNDSEDKVCMLPGGHDMHVWYLLEDGLVAKTGRRSGITFNDMPSEEEYGLTEAGKKLVHDWSTGCEIQ